MSQLTTSVSADWCCRLSPCALQKPSWHRPLACWICALPCPPYELTKGVVNHTHWETVWCIHFFSAYHCTFKMNSYQRDLLWRSIVAVTQIFYAGIDCFEYKIFACMLYVSDLLLFFLSFILHYAPIFSFTWPAISRRVPSWAWSCSRFCSCLFLFFPCDCCFWESGLLESSWRQYFLFCIILFFNLKLLETHNTYSKTLHLYNWIVVE